MRKYPCLLGKGVRAPVGSQLDGRTTWPWAELRPYCCLSLRPSLSTYLLCDRALSHMLLHCSAPSMKQAFKIFLWRVEAGSRSWEVRGHSQKRSWVGEISRMHGGGRSGVSLS